MLNINTNGLENKKFSRYSAGASSEILTCIGVGQGPDGANYVVGIGFDATRQVSFVRTELFKNIEFIGDLTNGVIARIDRSLVST